MALNVYLTFYKRYTAAQLKSLEWKYFLGCYGIPLIPSIILLCIHTNELGRVYGPAVVYKNTTRFLDVLFGWFLNSFGVGLSISGGFCVLRCFMDPSGIAFCPKIWMNSYFHRFIISGTFSIFIIVGRDVFRMNRKFRSDAMPPTPKRCSSSLLSTCTKTTIVEVQSSPRASDRLYNSPPKNAYIPATPTSQCGDYAIRVESNPQPRSPRIAADVNMTATMRSYLRCSFLFFIALVVTWVWLPPHFIIPSQILPNSESKLLIENLSSHPALIGSTLWFTPTQQAIPWTC